MTPLDVIIERIILANLDIDEVVKTYKQRVKEKAEYQAEIDKANGKEPEKTKENKPE